MGFSPLASHDKTVDSPFKAVCVLVLISNDGGAGIFQKILKRFSTQDLP